MLAGDLTSRIVRPSLITAQEFGYAQHLAWASPLRRGRTQNDCFAAFARNCSAVCVCRFDTSLNVLLPLRSWHALMRGTHLRLKQSGAFMGRLIGLIVTLLIVFGIYKLYFSQLQSATGSPAPTRSIEVTGVKNDLVALAQAERMYLAEHGTYATLDQLNSSGAMAMAKTGRDGYAYQAEASGGNSFRVVARCTRPDSTCTNYAIDETMEVRSIP